MRQRKSKTRNSVKRRAVGLDQRLEKRLISYALAASAAGVGALAGVPRAEAKVVFTNTWIPIAPTTAITNIDLNNDGVVDFVISNHVTNPCTDHVCSHGTMKVLPQGSGNAVWGTNSYASALVSGVSVGSKGKFQPGHEVMGTELHLVSTEGSGYSSRGPWRQATDRYLGVKFMIQGEVHYGWVRVDVAESDAGIYAAVSGYAYETLPNKSILTGQKSDAPKQRNNGKPSSASVGVPAPAKGALGILALGALGLQSWRGQDVPSK
jgi:hypothetical protein